ncbi:MAG: 50S ribosomal protein L30 [Rhodocyclaceae bacterium]|nr:50S ribosomal protein L30 [Rhodocyclaceae bacterium]
MATEKTTAEKPARKAAAPKAAEAAPATGKLRVTLVKSPIGTKRNHRASVAGLGLRRLNQTVEVADTPSNRGMVNAACFLLKCEA